MRMCSALLVVTLVGSTMTFAQETWEPSKQELTDRGRMVKG